MGRFVPVVSALVALAPASLVGQGPDQGWNARFTWAASAFSLDEGIRAGWRPAMGLRLDLGVKGHLDFEVAATGPLSTREATVCPDILEGCRATPGRPDFTLVTGALGVHTDIGRLRPFVGVGGGRIWVKEWDPSGVWLMFAGADYRVAGPFSLGVDYRASRTHALIQQTGVNQEWSLRVTVGALGAW